MTALIAEQLANIVGPKSVVSGTQAAEYAIDGVTPQAVAWPEDRAMVIEVLKWASAEKASVFPRGGGTKRGLGNTPERIDLVLDLRRLDRVLDYQPADMTVTTESGITLATLQQELADGGMFLPVEAPVATQATVGGTLSVAGSGPLAFAYGPPRDWLIGIGVISADGTATKAGGKVVKNVTGYDLNKLYTGSLGTLGVIVEATFKVSPQAPQSGALQASFSSLEAAIEAGRTLFRSAAGPMGYFCATGGVARQVQASHNDIASDSSIGLAFYSGRPRATKRRMDEGASSLIDAGSSTVTRLESSKVPPALERVVDLGWSAEARPFLALKISVPPQMVAAIAAALQRIGSTSGGPDIACDPGFGTVRTFWWDDSLGEQGCLDAISAVRNAATAYGGTTVVEHCPTGIKPNIDVWGEEPEGMEIMRRIKSKFDPDRILNPGRFLGRL